MMMARERIEEIIKELKSVDLNVTVESVEVDRDYITRLLGQCDDYTQKFEEFIIEVAFAVTQLENIVEDKKDLYEASHQELLTTDPVIKNLGTGTERANAAKYKLRDLTKEIKEHSAEFKELSTLKEMLVRRVKSIGSTMTSVKKQYEARIDSMRHSYLGERTTIDIPTSPLAEDDGLSELLTVTKSENIDEESEELNLDL